MAISMRWLGLRVFRRNGDHGQDNGRLAALLGTAQAGVIENVPPALLGTTQAGVIENVPPALHETASNVVPLPARAPALPPTPGGFSIEGRRIGVLLVHGLTSTPQSVQALGGALARNGLDVEGVLLPGHGTRPEDLIGVQWEQWYAAVREAVRAMRPRYDRIFVCGQSLGGSLALLVAAHEQVDGVISLAGIAYMRDWRLPFLPLIERFKPWRLSPGNDIAKPGVQDVGSYDRLPFSAVRQLLALAQQVRHDLPKVRVPALLVQSTVDHVVHTGNVEYIHDHMGSHVKEVVHLQRSFHVISLDNDFDIVVDRIVRFVRRIGCSKAES